MLRLLFADDQLHRHALTTCPFETTHLPLCDYFTEMPVLHKHAHELHHGFAPALVDGGTSAYDCFCWAAHPALVVRSPI